MTRPSNISKAKTRSPYAEAARMLLRESVLDALQQLLAHQDWSEVTMTEVAKAAGVSRQTLYNEFQSRTGLVEAYALRLADRLADAVDDAVKRNVGDIHQSLVQGFQGFFSQIAGDPLVLSFLSGEAKPDLMRLLTTDSGPIIERASARLTDLFCVSWIAPHPNDAGIFARALVRLSLSYVSTPPEVGHDVPEELALLMQPFIQNAQERAKRSRESP
ncbi:transcriptional regulator, TetR family [Segniliparus rotundus DSM 44985]|uniref:Transcriptional regulator, TetR family n=1 Tax=Segniliparus rotundus (strain ATCC BAA-972 / CDC 1076 / CIP 108378 / DSM 44985 / JCM 13578) TaxID=640132 RepID=D6ZDI0_SEGRD|nr:TetR family transcriptional regulator [Segniliparus rotundus]ADG97244.1 transcriptional regulator, TetR family [Segniliparus rotundus DSM 44985]